MESLRRRIPFKQDDESHEDRVLDEQEQEAVVEALRSSNASSNAQYRVLLQILLATSALLQLVCLFSSSNASPLFSVFPDASQDMTPIPLATCATILSLIAHGRLFMFFQPSLVPANPSTAFIVLHICSAIAPTTALLLSKPWQTTGWWCTTSIIVLIIQVGLDAIESGERSLAELESMMYQAPGA